MSRRKLTNPKDIAEIRALGDEYEVVEHQPGVWLIGGWLFLYPKNQKWGERYRQAYGFYERGKLREFVDKAHENKFNLNDVYHGRGRLQ